MVYHLPPMLDRIDDTTVRLSYALPFAEGPPPVNLYLLEADRPVLVDTGPKDDRILAELETDLATLGRRIEDLATVLVTHHHVDHSGLAGVMAERSGAPILLHEVDIPQVSGDPAFREMVLAEMEAAVGYWGLPERFQKGVSRSFGKFYRYASGLSTSAWTPLEEGMVRLAGRTFEVIHCPGHSAGLCVLWEAERGLLFANDHLLPNISSNPTYYIPPFRGKRTGLGDYLASLERIRDLPARLVLPGHGRPFQDIPRRVDELRAEYEDRRGVVLDRLGKSPAALAELVGLVWSHRELGATDLYLACRELHGHLDILIDEGLVESETVEGVGRFRRTVTSHRIDR